MTRDYCTEIPADTFRVGIEECEDNNAIANDCCTNNVIDFDCECFGGGPASFDTCREICGSGFDLGWYECDDGNLDNYDGCSALCEIEKGW